MSIGAYQRSTLTAVNYVRRYDASEVLGHDHVVDKKWKRAYFSEDIMETRFLGRMSGFESFVSDGIVLMFL